ncbi:MAG: uracil-DNA glycosylase family protein [Alphaproteobacteria bacterium]
MSDPLNRLVARIRACRVCRDAPRGRAAPLPHEPNPIIRARITARICIASQAAGTRAHASSTPFNDPSGVRLRAWMGLDRDTFYDEGLVAIVPMGFCFPGLDAKGGDRPPRKECAPLWRSSVFEHLPALDLILLVGAHAQKWHLGKDAHRTLTDTVAAWRSYGPRFLPMPHPSWRNNVWLKANPWFEADVLPHLRERVARLVREPQRERGA